MIIKNAKTLAAGTAIAYIVINGTGYLATRYVHKMSEGLFGKERECKQSMETINNLDNPISYVLFPLIKRGEEGYYETNCR